jgi:Fe-S cluster assembly scaffold protein SufB
VKSLKSGDQLQHLSGIPELAKIFSESDDKLMLRKSYIEQYERTTYETNPIFSKNFEKPNMDPLTYDPVNTQGPRSMLASGEFTVGAVGTSVYHEGLPEGLSFETPKEILAPITADGSDKFELLNAALRNSYHSFAVNRWKETSPPVSRVTVLPSKASSLNRYSSIRFGKDVVCTFVDRISDPAGVEAPGGFINEVVDVTLSPGADVNFVCLSKGAAEIATNFRFEMEEGARLKFVSWSGGTPYVRSRVTVRLRGHGGDAGVFTGNFVRDRARHDMLATVEHFGMRTVGLAVQNGVVRTGSRLILKGMMIIRNPARGSDSHLRQHALLLTPDSYANAIPGLEIETNELKAKHAASVSQPDDEQLFYLMSRGLNRDEAITTMAFGQLGHVITNIRNEELRESVTEEIMATLTSR